MVELRLTHEEAETVHEVVSALLGRMSMEIADTDNPRYRTYLRQRREILLRVRDTLANAVL
ncbi:hypothetical protein GCM10023215_08100 [Pseudonocardia yuanmonensis]|uniref:Uncharacterized protein n=1 Tax=Pseudonocardia yuanmonensis TaxID=1095914 RepID=A0ABP8W165_9PSEU